MRRLGCNEFTVQGFQLMADAGIPDGILVLDAEPSFEGRIENEIHADRLPGGFMEAAEELLLLFLRKRDRGAGGDIEDSLPLVPQHMEYSYDILQQSFTPLGGEEEDKLERQIAHAAPEKLREELLFLFGIDDGAFEEE